MAKYFDAELHILHVIPFTPPFPADLVVVAAANFYPSDRERRDEAHRQIEDIIAQHIPAGVRAKAGVKMGYAANEIVCAADDEEAEMIVMGTHGASGWRHLAFGSVAEKVVQMSHRPVLTVHGGAQPKSAGQTETATQDT